MGRRNSLSDTMTAAAGSLTTNRATQTDHCIHAGVDLGTAHIAIVALNDAADPIASEYEESAVVRDGVVSDFVGSCQILGKLKARLEQRIGNTLTSAHGAYPPGIGRAEVMTVRHIIESIDLDCGGLIDEPSAANTVLGIQNGAIVDVGGGTTGIAVIQESEVVHTIDEPTGGHHLSLVLAGRLGTSLETAEKYKKDVSRYREIVPVVQPVIEKIATIISHAIENYPVDQIHLVGGSVMLPGFSHIVEESTGITATVPPHAFLVTPLGIARAAHYTHAHTPAIQS